MVADSRRHDAAFIRKSSGKQDERAQAANVKTMLRERGAAVADEYWFSCTVSRAKVAGNEDFQRLIKLVEQDKIGTIYVESQTRIGTANVADLFKLLSFFNEHGTRLYSLRERTYLTDSDDSAEMQAFIGGVRSKKERQDISYQSLRTRVNNFAASGSWPTGAHPFGFAKACYASGGTLLWEWQPVSRLLGQIYFPDSKGNLIPGSKNVRIPRKAKTDTIKLVPSANREFVTTIRLIYDLYVKLGLTRRQISARLNKEGRKFYSRNFTHALVGQILQNPAYVGDTHFGKHKSGELHTFNPVTKEIETLKTKAEREKRKRPASERLIKEKTHEGLVNRKLWIAAQAKMRDEQARVCYPPRNSAYYLKPLLVCGHCGKNLTGRTEIEPGTKRRRIVYVCSSYVSGRSNGIDTSCGYHRISHEAAEKLILDKLAEEKIEFEHVSSNGACGNIDRRIKKLERKDRILGLKWKQLIADGVSAVLEYYRDAIELDFDYRKRQSVARQTLNFYLTDNLAWIDDPEGLNAFSESVRKAEAVMSKLASEKLMQLKAEHEKYTAAWVEASDMQRGFLKARTDEIESEILSWQVRTTPLSERLEEIYAKEAAAQSERYALLAEYPQLENREKGESLRSVLKKVTLFWSRTFKNRSENPTRPLRTNRPGRYQYTLLHEKTCWDIASCQLNGEA